MLSKLIEQSKLISLEEETHTYSLQNSDIEFQSVTEFIHTFFQINFPILIHLSH